MTDKKGTPVIGLDGKQMMTANPEWMNPVAYGKSAYDLTGSMLQWTPGTVRADRDSMLRAYGLKGAGSGSLSDDGNPLYKVFSSLFS